MYCTFVLQSVKSYLGLSRAPPCISLLTLSQLLKFYGHAREGFCPAADRWPKDTRSRCSPGHVLYNNTVAPLVLLKIHDIGNVDAS